MKKRIWYKWTDDYDWDNTKWQVRSPLNFSDLTFSFMEYLNGECDDGEWIFLSRDEYLVMSEEDFTGRAYRIIDEVEVGKYLLFRDEKESQSFQSFDDLEQALQEIDKFATHSSSDEIRFARFVLGTPSYKYGSKEYSVFKNFNEVLLDLDFREVVKEVDKIDRFSLDEYKRKLLKSSAREMVASVKKKLLGGGHEAV